VRVLIVTDWPLCAGGTERYVELLAESLREQGDDVRVLTSSAGTAADGDADYVAYGTDSRAMQAGLQLVNPSAVRTVRRALAEFRPEAVHLNMFLPHLSPAILRELRDVPTLLMVHDLKAVCPTGTKMRPDGTQCRSRSGPACHQGGCLSTPRYLRERSRYRMFRSGLRHVDAIYTISAAMQRELQQAGIDAEKVTLPVGRPAPGFTRRPADVPTFVYGGRLAPVKGVDVLLRAFARVRADRPDARLHLFADGPDREALEELAASLGLAESMAIDSRMWAGWADVGLQGSWAVVVPSVYREPLGLVPLEAIVRGVPVIASDTGGLSETVDDGVSGLLVPAGDEDALAAAMLDICTGRALPDRTVPGHVVHAARRRHDPASHARMVRDLLAGLGPRHEAVAA
jgi:glycosyltransferase involved in cell wall biosynthesis